MQFEFTASQVNKIALALNECSVNETRMADRSQEGSTKQRNHKNRANELINLFLMLSDVEAGDTIAVTK